MSELKPQKGWKHKVHEIIYEADTPMGKWFDIILFILIIISVLLVMLESVRWIDDTYHETLFILEWVVTIFFTIEYIARIITIKRPGKYIFSFYGIIDFLSTIPLYLSYIIAGSQALLAVRAFRLLRVFRILKLVQFLGEASQLKKALKASRAKITVFLFAVLIVSVMLGTVMYLIEGEEAVFTSIPTSIYWTIVTLDHRRLWRYCPDYRPGPADRHHHHVARLRYYRRTYGHCHRGKWGKQSGVEEPEDENYVHVNTQACTVCAKEGHRDDAEFCYNCGSEL